MAEYTVIRLGGNSELLSFLQQLPDFYDKASFFFDWIFLSLIFGFILGEGFHKAHLPKKAGAIVGTVMGFGLAYSLARKGSSIGEYSPMFAFFATVLFVIICYTFLYNNVFRERWGVSLFISVLLGYIALAGLYSVVDLGNPLNAVIRGLFSIAFIILALLVILLLIALAGSVTIYGREGPGRLLDYIREEPNNTPQELTPNESRTTNKDLVDEIPDFKTIIKEPQFTPTVKSEPVKEKVPSIKEAVSEILNIVYQFHKRGQDHPAFSLIKQAQDLEERLVLKELELLENLKKIIKNLSSTSLNKSDKQKLQEITTQMGALEEDIYTAHKNVLSHTTILLKELPQQAKALQEIRIQIQEKIDGFFQLTSLRKGSLLLLVNQDTLPIKRLSAVIEMTENFLLEWLQLIKKIQELLDLVKTIKYVPAVEPEQKPPAKQMEGGKRQLVAEDLTPEQIAVIEQRMRPTPFAVARDLKLENTSMGGFLDKTQSLKKVIEEDAKVLQHYRITHKQIGDRLDSLMEQAFRQGDLLRRAGKDIPRVTLKGVPVPVDEVLVEGKFKVAIVSFGGSQGCPFYYGSKPTKCGGGSYEFTVKNIRQGSEIKFSSLLPHLVRDHHFFEGNTSYRLDPKATITVLELQPGVDYTPKTKTEIIWKYTGAIGGLNKDREESEEVIRNAQLQTDLAPEVKLYLKGNKGVIVARARTKLKKFKINSEEVILDGVDEGLTFIERTEHEYVVS